MKRITFTLVFIILSTSLFAQVNPLKEKALDEFKKEHYNEAIGFLEQALKESPNDAEIYYYLGFFNHYRAYDSRPLQGYDISYSQKIFEYLDKAIALNPKYGDAKYFYGAECSGNAFIAMRNHDLGKLKYFFKLAFQKGAYPGWLLEYGRNMLNSCDRNAILFMGGNNDFDVCSYLQLYEKFRTDITIMPIGNIDRPWYVKFLKEGLEGGVRKIKLSLTDEQIMDIHPFKWKTTNVFIPVSQNLKDVCKLDANYKMQWTIEPDLFSDREQSKINGEQVNKRTFLSPQRAIQLQIIEDNYGDRPIFFSQLMNPFFYGGLDSSFRYCGLVSELMPIKTENTEYAVNYQKIELLIKKENFKDYSSIKENDLPRISGSVFSYHQALLKLANYYKTVHEEKKLQGLKDFFKENLAIGFDPENEKSASETLEKINN